MKRLSGIKLKNDDLDNQINVEGFCNLLHREQANNINLTFSEPLEE